MDVIKAAAGQRRMEEIYDSQEAAGPFTQLIMAAQLPQGNYAAGDDCSLGDLQGNRVGEDHIHRQDQILNRREMHREVRQQSVPLAGRHGKPGLLHLMEHLGKNAEVEARGTES